MSLWPHQEYALAEVPRQLEAGERKVCLTSPTGGGKTKIVAGLIEWALARGWKAVAYTNRRLLVTQLADVLRGHGIELGVRAANHADHRELPVQVSSLPTEGSRVLKSEKWLVHGHGEKCLALVDEAHLNGGATAQAILARHAEGGNPYVGVTATPIGLGHLYDSLVVAGTPSELRKCGALVPAYHFGPDEPDMKGFKPNVKTGEYAEGDVVKAVMHRQVFARVLEYYRTLNPEGRPTLLFAPGVKESVWFAEQFTGAGLRAAHIDGEGVWCDGRYEAGAGREAVLRQVRDGDISILCNRFVLREGLDLPEVSHVVLATVLGGLGTYLQSAGRGLRASPGKDRLTIQDHGGHWWRHGSVNVDRQWSLGLTENVIAGTRAERLRQKQDREPIVCPRCSQVRAGGAACPTCGFVASRKSRLVVQRDGTLREHAGDIFRPRRLTKRPDAEQVWEKVYYRARRSGMTFRQAEALYARENHWGWPPHTLRLMPVEPMDFFAKVKDVPRERLRA